MSTNTACSPLSVGKDSLPSGESKSTIKGSTVVLKRIEVDRNDNVTKSSKIVHVDLSSDDDFVKDDCDEPFDPVRTRAIEEGAFKWFSMDRAIKVLDSFSREAAPPSLKIIDRILQRKWTTLSRAQKRHYEEIAAYEFDSRYK